MKLRTSEKAAAGTPGSSRTRGGDDAEGEASLLWPPDVKSQCIGKDHDAGQD